MNYKAVQELIEELRAILASEKKMLKIIKDELSEIKKLYGDDRHYKSNKTQSKKISIQRT